ncbi:MAG: NAAT family transporter [Proteobacteria bacterium]|nr:MAG: NAAT family transporter [Pseudomonadota bacterium]
MDFQAMVLAFFSSFTALFAIVDPFALIPVFLSMTDRFTPDERKTVCLKSSLVATGILLSFAVAGERIFNLFGISIPAFQIAGGILLLRFGIAELSADRERLKREEESESYERQDISIFPLATPLLAGPGSISTVVIRASQSSGWLEEVILIVSVISVFVVTYFLLRSAPYLYRILRRTGLNLLTRIMGIILTAIAVQYIINGLTTVWNSLQASG